MAKSQTTDKPKTDTKVAPESTSANLPAMAPLRLPYPSSMQEWARIDKRDWQVLTDVIFPLATTVQSIVLAVEYCRSRKLDVMKKVVHIVPMRRKVPNSENKWEWVDTIWPGIAEVRITATRTGVYAGKDAAIFGPEKTETFRHVDDRTDEVKKELKDFTYPEWCQVTVYKIVQGQRCAFVGPKVYWREAYATESAYSEIPNEMWKSRTSGQLEKCAEAAALRSAFPEELGNEYTAEEMQGRTLEGSQVSSGHYAVSQPETLTPPRPQQSDFKREVQAHGGAGPAETRKEPEKQSTSQEAAAASTLMPEDNDADEEQERRYTQGSEEEPAADPEPERSATYLQAKALLDDKCREDLQNATDLDAYKKALRAQIDGLKEISDDERDMLRGQFTTMFVEEQQRRAKLKKR